MKIIYRSFLLLLCILLIQGCATSYSGNETYGQVVDAETGQPLEGVNVVAHWVVFKYKLERYAVGDLMLMETVTDKNGQFRFPSWGPKAVPSAGMLESQSPEVIFFKSGYEWDAKPNQTNGPPSAYPLVRTWDWNGKTIELKKYKRDLKAYGNFIGGILTGVSWGGCNWKKMPRMILALNKEDERLKLLGVFKPNFGVASLVRPSIDDLEQDAKSGNCGSVQDYLKDYQ
jgi:hypothetical protein